jgi:sugar phosphate isomerase/epimerase
VRLALSVRIAEQPRRKDRSAVPFAELARMAAAAGFEGLSLRASVVSVQSTPAEVAAVREVLQRQGLEASMLTGDLALAVNDATATRALYHIDPYLDLAEALGARLVRVMLHGPDDLAPARQAAERAAARGLVLCQQTHWGSLAETVAEALDTVAAIGHDSFRLTYEPANLLAAGEDPAAAIPALAPHLANAYYQNLRLDPESPIRFPTRCRGPVGVRFLALDAPGGIDPAPLIAGLAAAGYDGWFTVHQPLIQGETVAAAIQAAADLFLPLIRAAHRPSPS